MKPSVKKFYIPSVDYQHLYVDRPLIRNSALVKFLQTCVEGRKVLGSIVHRGEAGFTLTGHTH
jgi:hypothetical protein